jgi:hypothetical protein
MTQTMDAHVNKWIKKKCLPAVLEVKNLFIKGLLIKGKKKRTTYSPRIVVLNSGNMRIIGKQVTLSISFLKQSIIILTVISLLTHTLKCKFHESRDKVCFVHNCIPSIPRGIKHIATPH